MRVKVCVAQHGPASSGAQQHARAVRYEHRQEAGSDRELKDQRTRVGCAHGPLSDHKTLLDAHDVDTTNYKKTVESLTSQIQEANEKYYDHQEEMQDLLEGGADR